MNKDLGAAPISATGSECRLILGDCLDVMPTLPAGSFDAVIADPPYFTDDPQVPIGGPGVAEITKGSVSVGVPWGFSLDWVDAAARLNPKHWVVFCNYRMLGALHSAIERHAKIAGVFVWQKSNAPRMTRPVPRMDCEFILWAPAPKQGYGDMRLFESQVLNVPMLQAGCFATERILAQGSKRAAHPCQKPLAVVLPFVKRLPVQTIIDPFAGSGTTLVAAMRAGKAAVGIESSPAYFAIAQQRIEKARVGGPLFADAPTQASLMEM